MPEPVPQFARPFNLHVTDRDGSYVLHGAQFPSGRVITDHSEWGFATAAVSVEALLESFANDAEASAVIRWADEEAGGV